MLTIAFSSDDDVRAATKSTLLLNHQPTQIITEYHGFWESNRLPIRLHGLPPEVLQHFTLNHSVPVEHFFVDDSNRSHGTYLRFSRQQIEDNYLSISRELAATRPTQHVIREDDEEEDDDDDDEDDDDNEDDDDDEKKEHEDASPSPSSSPSPSLSSALLPPPTAASTRTP